MAGLARFAMLGDSGPRRLGAPAPLLLLALLGSLVGIAAPHRLSATQSGVSAESSSSMTYGPFLVSKRRAQRHSPRTRSSPSAVQPHGFRLRAGDDHEGHDHATSSAGYTMLVYNLFKGVNTITIMDYPRDWLNIGLMTMPSDWKANAATHLAEGAEMVSHAESEECGEDHGEEDDHDDGDHAHEEHVCAAHIGSNGMIEVHEDGHLDEAVFNVTWTPFVPMVLLAVEKEKTGHTALFVPEEVAENVVAMDEHGHLFNPIEWVEEEEALGDCESGLSSGKLWGYSILASMIGSLCSLVGIVLVLLPVLKSYPQVIEYLQSFAAGVLLSMVIVHLIPEAYSLTFLEPKWKVSTGIMAGFVLGMFVEYAAHSSGAHSHDHEPENSSTSLPVAGANFGSQPQPMPPMAQQQGVPVPQGVPMPPSGVPMPQHGVPMQNLQFPAQVVQVSPQMNQGMVTPFTQGSIGPSSIESAAKDKDNVSVEAPRMPMHIAVNILIGDFFHNFFDGFSTGVAFMACGEAMGWTMLGAITLHEIPQELADFGILISCGFSYKSALFFNFLSSLSSIIGVIAALGIGEVGVSQDRDLGIMLSVGAGILLYVAVNLAPELLHKKSSELSKHFVLFAIGAVIIGLLQLRHIHCECEYDDLPEGVDPHAGHNH